MADTVKKKNVTETKLLRQVGRGDAEAFGRLHASLYIPVRDFVLSRNIRMDRDAIDDLMQEVFLRLWKQASRFHGGASARTFTMGIAKNVLREIRRREANEPYVILWSINTIEDRHETNVEQKNDFLLQAVQKAKARLTADQRHALELVYFQGMPIADAALQCGCEINRFRNRIWRATMRLRVLLDHLPKAMYD